MKFIVHCVHFLSLALFVIGHNANSQIGCGAQVLGQTEDLYSITSQIHPVVHHWILSQQQDLELEMKIYRPGEKIKVSSSEVEVIYYLGKGSEGEVYLIRMGDELFALKVFYRMSRFSEYKRMASSWSSLPQVVLEDIPKKALVLKYFEGIPIADIANPKPIEGLLLSIEERQSVLRRWEENPLGNLNNAVYSVRQDLFLMIDNQ